MAVLGQTEVLLEDGIRIRTVGKARPWVLEQIPSLVDRLKLLIVTGIGRSTGPCIISVIRGHIHNCVNHI